MGTGADAAGTVLAGASPGADAVGAVNAVAAFAKGKGIGSASGSSVACGSTGNALGGVVGAESIGAGSSKRSTAGSQRAWQKGTKERLVSHSSAVSNEFCCVSAFSCWQLLPCFKYASLGFSCVLNVLF